MTNIFPLNIPAPKGKSVVAPKKTSESDKSGKGQDGEVSSDQGVLFNPLLAQMLAQQVPLPAKGTGTSMPSPVAQEFLSAEQDQATTNDQTSSLASPKSIVSALVPRIPFQLSVTVIASKPTANMESGSAGELEPQNGGGKASSESPTAGAADNGITNPIPAMVIPTIKAAPRPITPNPGVLKTATVEGTEAEESTVKQEKSGLDITGKTINDQTTSKANLQRPDQMPQEVPLPLKKTENLDVIDPPKIESVKDVVKKLDTDSAIDSSRILSSEKSTPTNVQKVISQVSSPSLPDSKSNQPHEENQPKGDQGQDHQQKEGVVSKVRPSETVPGIKDLGDIFKQQNPSVEPRGEVRQGIASAQVESTPAPLPEIVASLHEQIAKGLSVNFLHHVSEVRVALEPGSLGEVVVNVRIEDNMMVARIDVSHQNVKAMLDANIGQLHDVLINKGIQVDRIDILDASNASFKDSNNNPREKAKGSSKRKTINPVESFEPMRQLGYNTLEYLI